MKTTPREMLHDIQANYLELQKLLDNAQAAGIYSPANDLSGGWCSLDVALQRAAKQVDLDEGLTPPLPPSRKY